MMPPDPVIEARKLAARLAAVHPEGCTCEASDVHEVLRHLGALDVAVSLERAERLKRADPERLVKWMLDPLRDPATFAFTSGPERDVGYAFEHALREKEGR